MLLSRFGRFVLGLYSPFTPEDLRLTDVTPSIGGLSQITSRVGMSEADQQRLAGYQQQQHDIRDQLQESLSARELAEMERDRS
jgi:hypothetical protein